VRPRERKAIGRSRNGNVEKATFFFNLLVSLGILQRHQPFTAPHDEDGRPLQALGSVDARQGHAIGNRRVLKFSASIKLGNEGTQGLVECGCQFIRERHERRQ
jgi:hypothetical protein